MRRLLVLDGPDALGETWCWRFSLVAWCLLLAAASAIVWRKIK